MKYHDGSMWCVAILLFSAVMTNNTGFAAAGIAATLLTVADAYAKRDEDDK